MSGAAMKRKVDEEERFGSSRRKLDPISLDLKMAKVTRPAKSRHQNKLVCPVESRVRLGGVEKDTNPSKLDSLPFDLKMAILSRMPAKSLTKFRCVSKMWSSIIRSRGFIDSFFSRSSKQPRLIVALSNGVLRRPEEMLTFFFSFSYEGEESSCLLPNFEMAIPSVSLSPDRGYCASLHGILAVDAVTHTIMCNPSTEQFIYLPITNRFVGYDPIDDQYKALTFTVRNNDRSSGYLDHKVLTLGRGERWRHINAPGPYEAISPNVCINGFLYYGAYSFTQTGEKPVMVCFDVRSEKLSFIKAPKAVLLGGKDAVFIDYKGKLASIVRQLYNPVPYFYLWILEDVEKHEWSVQKCVFPLSVWDSFHNGEMSFPGTNMAGEIIMAPKVLSNTVQPFYIFYYNVETKNIRRVRLLGIGDDQEFRRSYGFRGRGLCESGVYIAPQHVESIAFL